MPSLKLDVRTAPQAGADLVTFFVKGSPLPPAFRPRNSTARRCSTVLLRDKKPAHARRRPGRKDKIEPDTLRRAAGAGDQATAQARQHGNRARPDRVTPITPAPPWKARSSPATNSTASARTPAKKRAACWRGCRSSSRKTKLIASARAGPRSRESSRRSATPSARIGNLPGNMLTPAILAEKAQELAKGRALTVKVWNETASHARRLRRHPRRRPGLGPSAAAHRPRISRRRQNARRPSRSSARRSPSTPAASRSSRARRWTK